MEQEPQSIDSLYDFLYVDKLRASSLTAQLYGPGVVTAIKLITSDSDKSTKGVGLDVKIFKGNTSVEEAINNTQEKQFDASWSLPINLLDKLSEAGLIRHGLNGELLGSTVVIKGAMRIFDISMLQKCIPFASKMFSKQLPVLPPKASKKKINPEDVEIAPGVSFGMVADLLQVVPNTLQVDFIDEEGHTIWMTINRDYLTINPDDMVLKYGGKFPGEWYVVGLIDAVPESEESFSELVFPPNAMKDSLTGILSAIKDFAGRDYNSYGMTPLIIFRKVT
ncbi:TPA: hypothetical protein MCW73_001727 [Klebsiella pneumoniae]|jgi:hypothetical protein|uniref:DUF6414 family protein n=1 Tax=Klebsiella pneumoniae TaxID=573 RepID=UPI000C7B48F4|nr:hypothetical protein [Klebsiella pneumoniae]HDS2769411.1 hypothetical protein [Klebsiella pneumoniae subsp. pneumoniae]MBZ1871779.1 hypothetical protein [Klebsiella pneumoniae]MEB6283051.1 hypothetical protein [Klebsiella pneumoniae]QPV90150.1 hypothetical protein I8N74_14045 [Klebsiella pneumoniae]HBT7663352.1 hypothetical protein [Klebsiella pneumoniae]